MSTATHTIQELANKEYKYGFVTDIESEVIPRGLNEDIIRPISAKKNEPEFMLEWRLKAYRHWLTMKEPTWANVHHPAIDYQNIIYYSAPKSKKDGPKSLTRSIRSCLRRTRSWASPCRSRSGLAGVAVDAVFDSVSVATTFQEQAGGDKGSFSARFPKRCRSIPNWSRSTWDRWFPTPTTSLPL